MSINGLRFDSPRHRPHPLLQSENFYKCFIHVNLSSTDNWNRAGTSLVQQLCLPSPEHLLLCFGLTSFLGLRFSGSELSTPKMIPNSYWIFLECI